MKAAEAGFATTLGEDWEGCETMEWSRWYELEEDVFEGVGRRGEGSGVLHF